MSDYTPYDKSHRLHRLYLAVTVVTDGQAQAIINLVKRADSALSCVMYGTGTAPSAVYRMFAMSDPKKNVVFSVIRQDQWPAFKKSLEERFGVSPAAKGIAFAMPIDSVFGVSVYKMLADLRSFETPLNDKRKKKARK